MAETPPERFFYHSFPRRFRGLPSDELQKGIAILEAIRDFGFVLTPEITEWSEPFSDGTLSEPWRNIQKRCCFTELAPSELRGHAETFGAFAIEFEAQTFRELGGMPVFYLPRGSGTDRGLESQAAAVIARIGEIQVLLNRLADLADLIRKSDDKSQLVIIQEKEQRVYTRSSLGAAEDIIAVLTHKSQPVEILRNALRFISGFFCPAEDLRYTGLLAYYRQREWRFVANMAKHGQDINRDPTPQEVDHLLRIDGDFFGKVLTFFTGDHRRVDQCCLYSALEGKRLIDYARRVVVPQPAMTEAQRILDGCAASVVALEQM